MGNTGSAGWRNVRDSSPRVVVTGLGCVAPLGLTATEAWASLREGQCALGPLQRIQTEGLTVRIGGEVPNFEPGQHLSDRQLTLLDRVSQFAVVAAREAVAAAGLDLEGDAGNRTAILVGTGGGGIVTLDEGFERLYRQGQKRAHPLSVPRTMVSAAASAISTDLGIRGPGFVVSSACSSASHAIGEALWMIRNGRADAVITGGTEAPLTFGTMKAWEALRVLATQTCRPFSADREGLVLAEGAAMMVLEPLEAARNRGAPILAELAGYGLSSDAGDIVAPSEEGAAVAMRMALAEAGLTPEDVDHINAHGTGTRLNDITETKAIRRVFGTAADRLAISATKSMHGHLLGGSGGLELLATVMAVRDGLVPPTVNYLGPDPDCDLDYTVNQARPMPIRAALSNSFAFGGLNAVLAVRAFEDR